MEQTVLNDAEVSTDALMKETVELERKRVLLEEAQKAFDEQQRIFEKEKREFQRKMEAKERQIEQQDRLFDMKWKLLEEKTAQLAKEREQVMRQKEFYARVAEFENHGIGYNGGTCEIMFTGVDSEQGLKRRYRDLLKIFHPDNPEGDTGLVQEISKEYAQLKQNYGR